MTSETGLIRRGRAVPIAARRIPGEPGLWVFLLADMAVFTFFFVAFLMERANEKTEFTAARESLGLAIGLTNTMILLVSSLFVVIALNAVRIGRRALASRLYLGAMLCGVVFCVLKATEYGHLMESGNGPDATTYHMWFFILTGTHLFHVLLGLVVLWVLFSSARSTRDVWPSRRLVFEGGSCYWHLVDLLWMVLFPLVYLAV